MMERRPFGNTGLRVSPIGLGTVKFGRDTGLKLAAPFSLPTMADARNLLALATDLRINLIDTAPAYGASEERLGVLLAGQRDRWVICTKVGEEYDASTGESRFDFSAKHTRFSVERSLHRLGVETLDIVLVHSDGDDVAIVRNGETLETLADMKVEGRIRAFGVSVKTVAGGLAALDVCDCAMVTYNLADSEALPVIELAAMLGKGILVKKPLASGHATLAGGGDPVDASFRHILAQPGVSSAIVGTIDPAHLRANVAACKRALPERGAASA